MLGSIYICTFIQNWYLFLIFYGIGFPIGIGLVYYTPIVCCWEWFPEKKGLMTGIIVAGFGFGSFIFGFVSTAIINPEDAKKVVPQDGSGDPDELYPELQAMRVPGMFRKCLIIWTTLSVLSVLLVSRNPEVKKEKMLAKVQFLMEDKDEPITAREAVKTPRFKIIMAMFGFGTFYGLYMASVYKE